MACYADRTGTKKAKQANCDANHEGLRKWRVEFAETNRTLNVNKIKFSIKQIAYGIIKASEHCMCHVMKLSA